VNVADKEKRLNMRSTEDELAAWREVADAEHLDLTTWLRRVAWSAVEKWRASRGKRRPERDGNGKKGGGR
jgi:hypothetical protein